MKVTNFKLDALIPGTVSAKVGGGQVELIEPVG